MIVIVKWFAHAHVDDVAQRLHVAAGVFHFARGPEDLFDHLAGRQILRKAALTRGAERALHRAAGLRRNAGRDAVLVDHQYRFDRGAVR